MGYGCWSREMRIIAVDSARTTWLFPLVEINPTGKSLTDVFTQLKQKYNFKKAPEHMFDVDPAKKGLIFEQGEFVNRDIVPVVVKLSVFTDGLVADCWSSTRDTEDFLKDLMVWLKTEHGLSLPSDRVHKTIYLSELTVTTDKHLAPIHSKMATFAKLVSEKVAASSRPNPGYTFGGFSLWARNFDQTGAAPQYRFELKLGSKLEDRRFYTAAPVSTEDHLVLLNEQEKLLFS
jgi:hypothetical protein